MFVAHRSQLHPVPDAMTDRQAVLVEPLACAIHAVMRARPEPGASVLVVGAGTVGALAVLALRAFTQAGRVVVVAKHRRQRELVTQLGATEVVDPGEAVTALRRSTRAARPRRSSEPRAAITCSDGSRGSRSTSSSTTFAGDVPTTESRALEGAGGRRVRCPWSTRWSSGPP